jgi:hypothetical protein
MQEELKGNSEQPGNSLQSPEQSTARSGIDVAIAARPIESAVGTNAPGRSGQAEAGVFSRLDTAQARQSRQYEELRNALDRYYGIPETVKTEDDRNRELRAQLIAMKKAQAEAEAARKAGLPGADVRSQIADQLLNRPQQPGMRPQPTKVTSLAEGIKSPGLKNLLTKAEELMKQGKFMPALDEYEAAGVVAQGNTLVMLGKANAELGAGLYERAAADMRRALLVDPVLTMAQFDLKEMMGQDRVETIVKDLKEIARKQEKEVTPALLLAYLAYNTGNETQAGVYLDLAQSRAGGQDAFIKLLQTHWHVPVQGMGATTQPIR